MNDPMANAQLELACRIGSLDDIIEALEDGADINCNGSSALFFAVQNGDRAVVKILVERGADVSCFELDGAQSDELVEQLMAMVPDSGQQKKPGEGMVELDAKMLRAFDRMIRNKGFAEPINQGRHDDYEAFCEGLRCVAAEECHVIACEFLELIKLVAAEGADADPDAAISAFLNDPENAERLADLGERYAKASEDEQPGELLKDYLKERKKIA